MTNTDYMIHLQLSFLSLEELREVDLLPEGLDEPDFDVSRSHNSFDSVIFKHLFTSGWLKNVTKFSCIIVMEDHNQFPFREAHLHEKMPQTIAQFS